MIYTSSIFGPVDDLILTSVAHLRKRQGLGGEDLGWGRGMCASLYTGSSV